MELVIKFDEEMKFVKGGRSLTVTLGGSFESPASPTHLFQAVGSWNRLHFKIIIIEKLVFSNLQIIIIKKKIQCF